MIWHKIGKGNEQLSLQGKKLKHIFEKMFNLTNNFKNVNYNEIIFHL